MLVFIFWLSTVGIAWYLHVGDLAGAAAARHHVASKHPSLGTRQATPAHSSHTHQLPSLSVHAIMLNHHCHPTPSPLVEHCQWGQQQWPFRAVSLNIRPQELCMLHRWPILSLYVLLGHSKTPAGLEYHVCTVGSVLCYHSVQWWAAPPLEDAGWRRVNCQTFQYNRVSNKLPPATHWWEPPSLPGVTGVEGQEEVRLGRVGSALWLVSYKAIVPHKACLPTAERDAIQEASSAPGKKRRGAALGRGVSPWPSGRCGVAPRVPTWTLQTHKPRTAVSPVCLGWSPPEGENI